MLHCRKGRAAGHVPVDKKGPDMSVAEEAQLPPVEQAAKTIATLTAKLAAIDARLAANAESRASLSFDALAGDDTKARSSLDQLSGEVFRTQTAGENVATALGKGAANERT